MLARVVLQTVPPQVPPKDGLGQVIIRNIGREGERRVPLRYRKSTADYKRKVARFASPFPMGSPSRLQRC